MRAMTIAVLILAASSGLADKATKPSKEEISAFVRAAYSTQPEDWSDEQLELMRGDHIDGGHVSAACGVATVGETVEGHSKEFTDGSWAVLRSILADQGYAGRDLEYLTSPDYTFGVGMSFKGLLCAYDVPSMEVRKSFYSTSGHHWQAIPNSSRFIYLEGDGTGEGMFITGWN